MKKLVLSLAIIFISIVTYSQSAKYKKNFEKGTKAIESKDYEKGISYLSLAIDELPNSDAYYNRAAAYLYLGDTCNYCNDLKKASGLNDMEAQKLFNEDCIWVRIIQNIPDSIKAKDPDIQQIKIAHDKCSSDSALTFIYKNEGNYLENSEADNSPVFTIVEEMPSFPGGENERNRFLAMNIIYPQAAFLTGIQGTVYVQFIIDRNGSVTDVKVLKGIGGGCDEEAMRVVKMMPKWKPGKQNGKPIRVIFNMPVIFRINKLGEAKRVDYYLNAMNYLKTGDTCKSCKDLLLARESDDLLAEMKYKMICFNHDTVRMAPDSILQEYPGYSYRLISSPKCSDENGYIEYFNEKNERINSIYEIAPEFPGGDIARMNFLQNNMRYPSEAREGNIQGTVYLTFFLEIDGTVTNIKVLRSPDKSLSKEAIRVVKLMPKWKPATQKGKPVRIQFNMPLKFTLQQ